MQNPHQHRSERRGRVRQQEHHRGEAGATQVRTLKPSRVWIAKYALSRWAVRLRHGNRCTFGCCGAVAAWCRVSRGTTSNQQSAVIAVGTAQDAIERFQPPSAEATGTVTQAATVEPTA